MSVVVEEGTNYPSALGYKNWPPTEVREGTIAEKAMALARGEMPIHLAQKIRAQITENPIIPFLDRPHPVLDMIKERPSIVPRVKLIGVLGVVDPAQVEKNVPPPYPRPMEWAPGRIIASLPSVIADIRDATGPERTVHPRTVRPSIVVEW